MPTRIPAAKTVAADIGALQEPSRSELKQRWKELYDSDCPTRLGRVLLARALAYQMQVQAFGGLDRTARRRLARATEDLAAGRNPAPPAAKIKPGTRLLREWQGVVHEVVVLERSVEYRNDSWPSLSAVAREITGTRWSGPRFFGLTGGAPNGRA